MAWNPITQPRDYAIIAGKKTPGICEIVGAGSIRDWDERKGYGLLGAISVFTGRGLAKFSIKLKLTAVEDWADWETFRPLVERMPRRRYGGKGKDSGALDILHPTLVGLDIKAIAVTKLGAPEQTGDGEWTITIDVIEFRRPKIALAKPDGPEPPTPVDPVDQMIERLYSQVDALLPDME